MAEKENIIIESGDRDQPFKYAIGMYGSMFSGSFMTAAFRRREVPPLQRCISLPGACAATVTRK